MDIYEKNPSVSRIIREEKLDEVLEIVKQWKREGKTKEEVLEIMDRQVLIDSDIDEIYAEDETIEEPTKERDNQDYLIFLKDEELIDYENQPFRTDNEEDNKELEDSIILNGIIEPIIVRPYQGKYQILSGHRRRKCGKKVGLEEFPCYVREKTDDEAKLYLVDTNLISREKIKPTERAKAYLLKKEALKNQKLREKVDNDILNDTQEKLSTREALMKENSMSNGNIQRYLRINYLNSDLQEAVDDNRIPLKVAEQLSFLEMEGQNIVSNILKDKGAKISEIQAKKIKQEAEKGEITKEKIENLVFNKNLSNKVTILFEEQELKMFFDNLKDKTVIRSEERRVGKECGS